MRLRGQAPECPTLCAGAMFYRLDSLGVVETAKILSIARDGIGISHVQFDLRFANRGEGGSERRTLALDHFRSLYAETVLDAE